MHVMMLKSFAVNVTPLTTKTYAADWVGVVPDDIGTRMVQDGVARRLDDPNPVLTTTEVGVLKDVVTHLTTVAARAAPVPAPAPVAEPAPAPAAAPSKSAKAGK